jgi:NTE family protein
LGLDSQKLDKLLSKPETFNAFFDNPTLGIYRSVNKSNKPDMFIENVNGRTGFELVRQRVGRIKYWDSFAGMVLLWLNDFFDALPPDHPAVKQINRHKEKYVYNLVFDRGLFPGLEVRSFFSQIISGYLSKKFLQYTKGVLASSPNGGDVSFNLFYQFTGVDLMVTGANVTRHRPAFFSRHHTPNFPVAEAVAISMNLPFLFKPVLVQADVPVNKYNERKDVYQGFWIDGGILNNLPLHAFDDFGPPISSKYPNVRVLHPKMLGLRLTSNPDTQNKSTQPGLFDNLKEHGGNIFETFMFPSEEGQIRSQDEAEQTIDLKTYDLETVEFAPSAEKRKIPIREAEKAVMDYFQAQKSQ